MKIFNPYFQTDYGKLFNMGAEEFLTDYHIQDEKKVNLILILDSQVLI